MYNWINILYPVYILIIAYCHCSMSVYFHCRALRAFTHVCISTESFRGSYPDPMNKYTSTIIHTAFISVHCHRLSAWATPMIGVVINPKKIWCPMWGLQLVVTITEAHQHKAAACRLANGWPQSHTKFIFFWRENSSKHMTFQQPPTGQLWQCTTPSQSAMQMEPCAQGLCPYNIRGC